MSIEADPGWAAAIGPVPAAATLWHSGVHKTGTTALQSALAHARPALARAGVLYPGTESAHHRAALAAVEKRWGWAGSDGRVPDARAFDDLVREVHRWPGRSIVSSEHLCEADDATAARIVRAVGSDRMHVLITLRPLAQLLPSSWQQYLKYGHQKDYVEWLRAMFAVPPGPGTPSFWRRNRHGELVARWARLVGAEHVTVVVLDGLGRDAVFRSVARLLAVDDRVLTGIDGTASNRSMTAPESELLVALNRRARTAMAWSEYRLLVRNGLARELVENRVPPSGEPRLVTPGWALDAAAAAGAEHARAIEAQGVHVVGDLGRLSERPPQADGPIGPDGSIPLEVAADALAALLRVDAVRTGVPSTPDLRSDVRDLARRWRRAVRRRARRR